MDEIVTAYCMKCRASRTMREPQAVYTANGTPATRGTCAECGTTLFKMGRTSAHEGLPKPERVPAAPASRATRPTHKSRVERSRAASQTESGRRTSGTSQRLVIVESPAKARTIGKFLGSGYVVKASVGHVRDLLRSQLSVDVDHDFAPKYRVPQEKRQVVEDLKAAVKRAAEVYLATDPDREGEAIAWHLVEAADIAASSAQRVIFHEITGDAIAAAFEHPQHIDMDRVNAQQARRILDRLVGYKLSPLLWDKVRNRTSAGRVQSVAVRLVVEREREIAAFAPEEYWSIEAELARRVADRAVFIARLIKIAGEPADLKNEPDTRAIVDELERSLYVVTEVRRGERKRKPSPPFTTSTLQQEASRRLGFTARRTMRVAQQLYEGIDLGRQGSVGLITYMRTDSTNVAASAQDEARRLIASRFGSDALPDAPPTYRTRSRGAQEAHEAIRPTSVFREPAALKAHLSADQMRLYALIWQRFVASQMLPAVYDTMTVDVMADPRWPAAGLPRQGHTGLPQQDDGVPLDRLPELTALPDAPGTTADGRYLLRASGSRVRVPGFLAVYEESRDDDAAPDEELGRLLPDLQCGEVVDLRRLIPEQHFTQPPPRYTEATLVRALEENGIGRPSTYAPIISTIQDRGYVAVAERRLYPTELGFVVNDLLVEHFPDVVDVGFTVRMEEDLDQIARGERDWVPVLREFYTPFEQAVTRAEQTMTKVEVANQPTGEKCGLCGHDMVIKWGRFGKFIACSDYPTCRNTRPYLEKIDVACPRCGGDMVERKTRKGRVFYGCSNYPTCDFTSWKRPLAQPCPACGGLLVATNRHMAECQQCGRATAVESLPETPAPVPAG